MHAPKCQQVKPMVDAVKVKIEVKVLFHLPLSIRNAKYNFFFHASYSYYCLASSIWFNSNLDSN